MLDVQRYREHLGSHFRSYGLYMTDTTAFAGDSRCSQPFVQRSCPQPCAAGGGGEEKPAFSEDTRPLKATPFGSSAYRANFSIKDARFVRTELERLLDHGLILKDELHLCYVVTPFKDLPTPDWTLYLSLYHKLDPTRQRISQSIGISEGLLLSRSVNKGFVKKPTRESLLRAELVLKRFFAALVICDLVNEVPMAKVEAKYKVTRGHLQSLLRTSQVWKRGGVAPGVPHHQVPHIDGAQRWGLGGERGLELGGGGEVALCEVLTARSAFCTGTFLLVGRRLFLLLR